MKNRLRILGFALVVTALTVAPAAQAKADIFWWIRKVVE